MQDSRVGDFSINKQYYNILDKLAKSTEEQELNEKDWEQLITDLFFRAKLNKPIIMLGASTAMVLPIIL